MTKSILLADIGALIDSCDELSTKLKKPSVHLDNLTGTGFVYLVQRGIQLLDGSSVHIYSLNDDKLVALKKLLENAEVRLKDRLDSNSQA